MGEPVAPILARLTLPFKDSDFTLDVDLALPGNGVTAIFGASGSGKTTLLRCLAGLERPARGLVSVKGDIWQDDTQFVPTHQRPLGYVFQEASLFPHLNAEGNLRYALKRASSPVSPEDYQRVLDTLAIRPLLSRRTDQLSGGERQRVAIARALLIQPGILLMDEPLASLDAARKREILPYLEKMRASFNIPVVYVSHSVDEVTRLADQVVILDQGRAVAQGKVTEVFSRADLPQTQGKDVGVVWQAQAKARDERWHLLNAACDGGDLWLRDSGEAIGDRFRVRILARDVSLALSCHADTSILNRLPVEVLELIPDQDSAMVLVQCRAGNGRLLARVTRRSAEHLQLQTGQSLWAQVKSVAIVH